MISPIAAAAPRLADFDGASIWLTHRKGRPPQLRIRYVTLATDGVRFFNAQLKRKLPAARIFTEDGAQPWRRHRWARAISALITEYNHEARGKQRVPKNASAYSFRHSRIGELLQLDVIDPLTVAHQTGTSLVMIEKAYFRFSASAMRGKLEAAR